MNGYDSDKLRNQKCQNFEIISIREVNKDICQIIS